ncbi:TPA: hypothetical protein ACXYK5_002296 [Legionella pneumophila]
MTVLTSQEILDDCNETIKNNGLSASDFHCIYTDKSTNPNTVNGQYIIMGEALVKNIKNNKSKKYSTGMGTTWPLDLENDLKAGFFN